MGATLKSRLPAIAAALPARVDAAISEGAEVVAQYARFRVPVDEGDLRDAIHVDRDRIGAYEVVAGDSEVFYGHMVEYGTARQPPRPFLVPALDDGHGAVLGLVAAALRDL